jgi:hypothetical protein
MFHRQEIAVNQATGVPIKGVIVRAYDASGNLATLYSDANSTPIVSVSGIADAAVADSDGNYSYYVANGVYTERLSIGDAEAYSIANLVMQGLVTTIQTPTFANAASITTSSDTNLVIASGTSAVGDAGTGRQFAYDATVDAAYVTANPTTSFVDGTGRGFREITAAAALTGAGIITASAQSGATDTLKVQAAITAAHTAGGGFVVVSKGMAPDWTGITTQLDVAIQDIPNARLLFGNGGGFSPGGTEGGGDHVRLQPIARTSANGTQSFLYVEPVGINAWNALPFSAAVKLFATEYDGGKKLDGTVNTSFPDYVNGGFAFNSSASYAHGGRALIWSKGVNNYGPMVPDIYFAVGGETTSSGLRVCWVEPKVTPAGPHNAGGDRVFTIPGAAWRPGLTVNQGDRFVYYGRLYEACATGTLNSTIPYFDDVGGRQRDAENSGTTTQGTLTTIGSWTGYTGDAGTYGVQLAFIADLFFGTGWGPWRQQAVIGDPSVHAICGTGLYAQFTSDFGVRQGFGHAGIDPATGLVIGRCRSVGANMVMECGATAGATGNASISVTPTAVITAGKPLLIGSAVTKTDAATTLALTNDNQRITFNDSGATSFTGFTGLIVGAEYTLIFNTGNTTLVHGTGIRVPGGANWAVPQYSIVRAYAVSTTQVFVSKLP